MTGSQSVTYLVLSHVVKFCDLFLGTSRTTGIVLIFSSQADNCGMALTIEHVTHCFACLIKNSTGTTLRSW